jgi:putative transposase
LLDRYNLQDSMSRKGNYRGKSVIKRFFPNLKMERVWRRNYTIMEKPYGI